MTRTIKLACSAVFAVVALSLASLGCDDKAAPTPEQHASTDVVPGSHADWCGEHAVPESQCTQCHTELIAAFKATGDWCGDHGMPKSHCKKCDPTLVIARPAKPGDAK